MDGSGCDSCGGETIGGDSKEPPSICGQPGLKQPTSAAPWLALIDLKEVISSGASSLTNSKHRISQDLPVVSCSAFITEFLRQVYSRFSGLPALDVQVASVYHPDCDRTDRAIYVSEQQSVGEVLVLGLFVEEHGDRAAHPHTVYIQYLEKSGLADPAVVRKPSLVTAVMVAYMNFVSCLFPCQIHIWADPPDEDYPDYVFFSSNKNTPVTASKTDGDLTGMYKYIATQGGWQHKRFEYSVPIPTMPVFNAAEAEHDWHHADVKGKPHVRDMLEELRAHVARLTAAINDELTTTVVVDVPQRLRMADGSAHARIPGFMLRRSVNMPEFPFDGMQNGLASSAVLLSLMRESADVDWCCTAPRAAAAVTATSSVDAVVVEAARDVPVVAAAAAVLAAVDVAAYPPWVRALQSALLDPRLYEHVARAVRAVAALRGSAAVALYGRLYTHTEWGESLAAVAAAMGLPPSALIPPSTVCAVQSERARYELGQAASDDGIELEWMRASAVPRVIDILI